MSPTLESLQNRDLAEEIEAINAIFDPSTIDLETLATTSASTERHAAPRTLDLGNAGDSNPATLTTTTVTLHVPNHSNLSFIIGFDEKYPDTPPRIIGTASTASRGEGRLAVDVLAEIIQHTHQPGQVCLFEAISEASERFSELDIGRADTTAEDVDEQGQKTQITDVFAALSLKDTFGIDSPPAWIVSDVVTEKKSVFVGRAAHVTSLVQAEAYIDHLVATDKRVAAATHNISAWRIREKKNDHDGNDGAETVVQDCDDDGETAAGGRLLHLMQLMDVWDVLVVVTRWYGGVLLGPDRFRIINNVGKDALVKGGFVRNSSSNASAANKEKGGGKKKGRK
jgi:putative IMPACT (imprinted ancient) family translation regulator